MTEYVHRYSETDLASRQAAARVRLTVEDRARAGDRVVLDFGPVESLSASYADELFGVLAARYGLDWLATHLRPHNVRPPVSRAMAAAIRYRLDHEPRRAPGGAIAEARRLREARR
jgi:hypothetical protein